MEDVESHLDLIASMSGSVSSRVYEVCVDLAERGIVEFKGRYARVTPLPLALKLVSDRWNRLTASRAEELIVAAKEYGLDESLCDQLKMLHYLSHAQDIVDQLCGPMGPFGNADVLSTEWGSRLLRSFASVNPPAVIKALWRSFGEMTDGESPRNRGRPTKLS